MYVHQTYIYMYTRDKICQVRECLMWGYTYSTYATVGRGKKKNKERQNNVYKPEVITNTNQPATVLFPSAQNQHCCCSRNLGRRIRLHITLYHVGNCTYAVNVLCEYLEYS